MLLEYPSNMIFNYRLFSVHRKIQYYTDDVNFRIDQKGFSSISYTLMYSQPRIYIYTESVYMYMRSVLQTLVLEERQKEQELT